MVTTLPIDMKETSGKTTTLPPLAPYPPPNVRLALPPDEWQHCLEAWILAVEIRLRLSCEDFKKLAGANDVAGNAFLESYVAQSVVRNRSKHTTDFTSRDSTLKRLSFLFARRLILESGSNQDLFPNGSFHFLSKFCQAYSNSPSLKNVCELAWKHDAFAIKKETERAKAATISFLWPGKSFDASRQSDLLRQFNVLLGSIPEIGLILMTGSDFIDSLDVAYRHSQDLVSPDTDQLKRLVATLYRCLKALMKMDNPPGSLLMDQIFSLRALHDQRVKDWPKSPTLLSDLLYSTPFLNPFQTFLALSSQKRGDTLLGSLQSIQASEIHLFSQQPRRNPKSRAKGKARARTEVDGEMHAHSLTLVSQVQELFPDLRAPYVLRLLSYFQDDVEAVTAALLEPESLPPSLQNPAANESEVADQHQAKPDITTASDPAVPQRRNAFENDDFSNLRVSASQLHFGKKDKGSVEHVSTSERSARKAAILSALARFDSDSDERDDTYDVADVGGTVDTSLPGTDDAEAQKTWREQQQAAKQQDKIEEALYRTWKSDSSLFARDTKTRLSQPRTSLKHETGWTDEQIEGWALMLQRDSRKINRLEGKFGLGASGDEAFRQTQIQRTAWRASNATSDAESEVDGDTAGPSNPPEVGGRGRGRGRGRSHSNRAMGNVAGAANDHATQQARRRKEQGKGGRGGGNHGRREGRAKKIARGFGGPAA